MDEQERKKCTWGEGISVRPDGVNELDPCLYKDVQIFRNVTVVVSRCVRCGNISIGWYFQDNTETVLDLMKDE